MRQEINELFEMFTLGVCDFEQFADRVYDMINVSCFYGLTRQEAIEMVQDCGLWELVRGF